ncbi:multiubiquitin domain-containing protein [Brevundimonas sp.]|uniref:multiubiquitin domain-containing protein n=1 Tax=Brevundimonas sp. TaxID=1871086 RepID=UPI003D0DCB58
MQTTASPEDVALDRADAGGYRIEISDETFEVRLVRLDDRKVVGLQIAEAAGKRPIEDFAVLRHLKTGEIESLRPTEPVDLTESGVERFFIVRGSSNHRFTVEGLAMEWPRDKLAARHIKFLAGAKDDQILILDGDDGDRVLDDDEEVDLSAAGVERFKLRTIRKTVTVFYKEAPYDLERRAYTTEELLGVFSVPSGYKLDLIENDGEFRELKAGEQVKVREGMEFSSHPPVGQSS